jgi:NAD-dependent SIR2 family protein deacetylase
VAVLDPIVSLAVAIAESPGLYAFLLGSGVSRDAGVPTGGEVLRNAQSDLYRLVTSERELPAADGGLEEWLKEQGHAERGYSEILALLAPDQEGRRAYLAKYFEGREPGEAHRLLAKLSEDGLARVFVTTNFDRLLEAALAEVGITPVLVASEDDLRRSSQREHATSYLVKAHGDYLQQTIRNTAEELAQLDSALETEVQEIFDRYGCVVLGYSGSDEALMGLLRSRRSRYGIYWVSRTPPVGDVAVLLESLGGRVILRDSAAEFLADLSRRIDAFRAHPSGDTPQIVSAEMVTLLRARDEVGLREKLKEEWRAFNRRVAAVVEPRIQLQQVTTEDGSAIDAELMPGLERMLAALLPLLEHRSPLFAEQGAQMARVVERAHRQSPTIWPQLGQWAIWWMAQTIGAYAMATGNYEVVGQLLRMRIEQDKRGSVASMHPTKIGEAVVAEALKPSSTQTWAAPEWQHLIERLGASGFLVERYPELIDEPGVMRWLNDFNFLVSYAALRADESFVVGYWGMYYEGALALAKRLKDDPAFREEVSQASLGITGDEFVADARIRMARAVNNQSRRIWVPGHGLNSEAINALPEAPAPPASV